MRLQFFSIIALIAFGAAPGLADPIDQVVARLDALERKNEALARENAALKQRIGRLESATGETVAEKGPSLAAPVAAAAAPALVTTAAVVPTSAHYDASSSVRRQEPEEAFTWTGGYVGIHGGGAWGDLSSVDELFPGVSLRDDQELSGGVGGVQLGANKQFGNWVIGGELSVSGARIDGSSAACFSNPAVVDCDAQVNWIVTGLARLGYAHERWLFTGSAGWSIAGADYGVVDTFSGAGFGFNETLHGMTYGAGVDYALSRSISFGVEYLHADLSADGQLYLTPVFFFGKGERDLDLNIARAQLNFKFGQ